MKKHFVILSYLSNAQEKCQFYVNRYTGNAHTFNW